MAKKFSQFSTASTLEGFTFAGLQAGDNSKAPVSLLDEMFAAYILETFLYQESSYLFVAADNTTIANSSWTAIFGENHTIGGIFNDGIIAGEEHYSTGDAGNNAIFGRENKLTGTGTKNFNLIAGDDNEVNASGINFSVGNFIVGSRNTLNDASNSAIIGSDVTATEDNTLYVNNLAITELVNVILGTDGDGNVVAASGFAPLQKDITGTTHTVDSTDIGYILYCTNVSGCTITIPDTLGANVEFATVVATGAGPVDHVGSGTSVLHTADGQTELTEENTAAHWVSKDANDWYGFGAFGGGPGIQNTIDSNNLISEISFIDVSTIISPVDGSPVFGIESDSAGVKSGLYMVDQFGAGYFPALISGVYPPGPDAARYVTVHESGVSFGATSGMDGGYGFLIQEDRIQIQGLYGIDMYFGESPGGFFGLDWAAQQINISSDAIQLTNTANDTYILIDSESVPGVPLITIGGLVYFDGIVDFSTTPTIGGNTVATEVSATSIAIERVEASVWKQPVKAASTGNVDITNAGTSIDGVSINSIGTRVLLKDQSTASQNGIYAVSATSPNVTLARASDFDSSGPASVFPGVRIPVSEGTVNELRVFKMTTQNPITLGTTALSFQDFMYSKADIAVINTLNGIIQQSPDGTYWRQQVNNAGVATWSNIGSTLP